MKLFFDENFGSTLPDALRRVRAPADAFERPRRGGPIDPGAPDFAWLAWVGQNGFLGLSEDLNILASETERTLAQAARTGLVFFRTGQSPRWQALRLILKKWDWLELVDRSIERPFAFIVSASGRHRRVY